MNERAQFVAPGVVSGRALAKVLPGLNLVERLAWRVPMASPTLLTLLGVGVAVALAGGGSLGAWVIVQNDHEIAEAQSSGFALTTAASDFRSHLAAADAHAASLLLAGPKASSEEGQELPAPLDHVVVHERFTNELEQAGESLASAGLAAGAGDEVQIDELSTGLTDYLALVELGYANARLGHPVATDYLHDASALATAPAGETPRHGHPGSLVATADGLRLSGERRLVSAANRVGGGWSVLAMAWVVVAPVLVAAAALVVAGRTRRVTHPGFVVAMACASAVGWLVVSPLVTQRHHVERAATTDVETYRRFDDTAVALSHLRMAEVTAVSRHGAGGPFYQEFESEAWRLLAGLDPRLAPVVGSYGHTVAAVKTADLDENQNLVAAGWVVSGPSQAAFGSADRAIAKSVTGARAGLQLDLGRAAAADEKVHLPGPLARADWVVPLAVGWLGALATMWAAVTRSRSYGR